ncbi:NAD-dependent epimerase/dehydratase family protein [Dyadobacter fanqingshengii]|uniref:NAD(P)-dependent oxidoreductase n=1 Tax=Dyadobacter fanqingshengii TaxID=2906443 RepID=A0A9X1PAC6_9BACT|nr:NAD(P)-dependent oxidoreductase [Dyadobacter fanqingshengii]MCF0040589.1 NAD(P)-dependent oxidoreductase [Dyadobacter fanqingshengii]USJ37673.1 NAD(P)-dependent oxidoreductase [Dyadobacter fanqingshengii]
MTDFELLEEKWLSPSDVLIEDMKQINGDILILGAGGKIGPSIAKLAKQAIDRAGLDKRVIGVSRFSDEGLADELNAAGIETIAANILNDAELQALPEVENVLYLAGTKFGTSNNEPYTWAMNTYLPGRVAEKFKNSKIVVYSTGNVYPFTTVASGGATEELRADPVGEYGQSCLGRERLFQYFSSVHGTPLLIYRLNYAIDFKYGVLLEVAKSVLAGKPVDLRTGHVNVIWQGDANEMAIRSLLHCESPSKILNITGPETVSLRWLAAEFGRIFNTEPQFVNEEQPTALLSNAAESFRLFGYPRTTLKQMIGITAQWLQEGGKTINKPTHFQERKGQF